MCSSIVPLTKGKPKIIFNRNHRTAMTLFSLSNLLGDGDRSADNIRRLSRFFSLFPVVCLENIFWQSTFTNITVINVTVTQKKIELQVLMRKETRCASSSTEKRCVSDGRMTSQSVFTEEITQPRIRIAPALKYSHDHFFI